MKPIPVSLIQRPICSGLRSILTPSEARTSAAPERDDSARLPCLAPGMPVPATMNDAQVETLTEPEPSPPVPTISIASGGAFTRSILERIAETAPVISSTVSPRTRNAIRSAPICEGVASPDIRLSKAETASSRDSVVPVATLPMIDLRSSMPRLVVARPGYLREAGLVDRRSHVLFELCDVLRNLLVIHAARQLILQFLHVVGGEVDRGHVDVGDAEHDPLIVGARRLAVTVFRGPERRGDRARL